VENSIRDGNKLTKANILLDFTIFRRIDAEISLFRFENIIQPHQIKKPLLIRMAFLKRKLLVGLHFRYYREID